MPSVGTIEIHDEGTVPFLRQLGWGADRLADKDPRLTLAHRKMALSPRNANTMWMLHFLSHPKEGGTAGFVMATDELSNGDTARLEVRKALVDLECGAPYKSIVRLRLTLANDS